MTASESGGPARKATAFAAFLRSFPHRPIFRSFRTKISVRAAAGPVTGLRSCGGSRGREEEAAGAEWIKACRELGLVHRASTQALRDMT